MRRRGALWRFLAAALAAAASRWRSCRPPPRRTRCSRARAAPRARPCPPLAAAHRAHLLRGAGREALAGQGARARTGRRCPASPRRSRCPATSSRCRCSRPRRSPTAPTRSTTARCRRSTATWTPGRSPSAWGARPARPSSSSLVHDSPWASALTTVGRWLLYVALVVLIGAASTSLFVYGGRCCPGGGVTVLGCAVDGRRRRRWRCSPGARSCWSAPRACCRCSRPARASSCWRSPSRWCSASARWCWWTSGRRAGASGSSASRAPRRCWCTSPPATPPRRRPSGCSTSCVQWVHLTAVGVWVGGLLWLLLGFRGRDHGGARGRGRRLHPHRHRDAGRGAGDRAGARRGGGRLASARCSTPATGSRCS